jgi:hypothetical protein
MDPLVKILNVEDVGGIDARTLAPNPHTKVTYMVGVLGPFELVTPSKDFSSQYVNEQTQIRADHLRAIGVVT